MALLYTALWPKKRNKSPPRGVLANVDQEQRSSRNGHDSRPVRVEAPHEYDGIGQALRSAYRNDRTPPDPIANVLRQLNTID